MKTLTRAILVALALLAGASAAMANPMVRDQSDQYGGYHPNSLAGERAFWENQSRNTR
jgi:hypothetical protein